MTSPRADGPGCSSLRPLLLSVAHQMVGSISEAEDIVQEALLRFHRAVAEGTEIAANATAIFWG